VSFIKIIFLHTIDADGGVLVMPFNFLEDDEETLRELFYKITLN